MNLMNTLINLFKIYLGFFVENTFFSTLIYGLIFNCPILIYFSLSSYLNILLWVYLKKIINFNFLKLTSLRPSTELIIDSKIATVIYKFSKFGMPSLHSIYTGYTIAFWYLYIKNFKMKSNIHYLLLLFIIVTGSRIYFNVHTFGQVIIGSLIGILSGYLSFYLYIFYLKLKLLFLITYN